MSKSERLVVMMKIVLSNDALSWFKHEMETTAGDAIRFFARYGGTSQLHEGFSLGVTKEQPDEAEVTVTHEEVLFYIESRDIWYFLEHDLLVDVDTSIEELTYSYEKA